LRSTFIYILFLFLSSSIPAQIPIPNLKKEAKFQKHKFIPFYNFKKRRNTTLFQGNKKRKQYFEGWYFKMVGKDGQSIISVIPGISLSEDGETQHAFIQIINGKTAETSYHSFPIESFSFSRKDFAVKIADNYFSEDKLILNIVDGLTSISAEISMTNLTEFSNRKLAKRNIMGWYRKVPFMQCYHGVVSLTHDLSGYININNTQHDFSSGKGYIEKDWGSSMPSSWIWMQSNNFEESNSSFMISIADIPWLRKSFNGFLGFFYHNEKVYRFATYRRSKLEVNIIDEDAIKIVIKNRKERIEIEARRNSVGLLQAPVEGSMDRRIPESVDAEIKIKLFDKKGKLIYSDKSNIAGFELVGDIKSLIENIK